MLQKRKSDICCYSESCSLMLCDPLHPFQLCHVLVWTILLESELLDIICMILFSQPMLNVGQARPSSLPFPFILLNTTTCWSTLLNSGFKRFARRFRNLGFGFWFSFLKKKIKKNEMIFSTCFICQVILDCMRLWVLP